MLKNINRAARDDAHRLLQCLTVAVRPLRLEELAEVLAFDFDEASGGIPSLNADWRREDQEHAVLSTCSSLITVVQDGESRVVQFSHFSVKEFLTSDRLAVATEDISFHHIILEPAHTILAQACLGVLLRLDDSIRETFVLRFPLADYAAEHLVDHALFENVSFCIKDGMDYLFDPEMPHLSRWIWIQNMDDTYAWPDGATRPEEQLEATALYYAAFCGFFDVMEKLIREHPEHVSVKGGPCGTALHAASRKNHLKIVQSLLKHGAGMNALGLWERTPLQFASLWGHLEVGLWLLEHGADVNAKDEDGWTSLHLAAAQGHFELVRTLLMHDADTNARTTSESTPLYLASCYGQTDVARSLLDHGADPMARDKDQETSLHMASSRGYLDIARLLLERGADVNSEDNKGRTAYQIALNKGYGEVAQLLSAYGVEIKT